MTSPTHVAARARFDDISLHAVRNAALNFLAFTLVALGGLAVWVISARALGPALTGMLGSMSWFGTFLVAVMLPGLPIAVSKYLSEAAGRGTLGPAAATARQMLRFQMLAAFGGAALLALLFERFGAGQTRLLAYSGLMMLVFAVRDAYSWALSGYQAYGTIASLIGWTMMAEVACVSLAAALHAGLVGLFCASCAGAGVGTVLFAVSAERRLRRDAAGFQPTPAWWSRMRRFTAAASWGTLVQSVVLQRSEVILLVRYVGASEAAYYTIAFSFFDGICSASASLCNGFLPLSSHAYGRSGNADLALLYTNGLKYLQVIMVPACFGAAALASPIVRLLYGTRFLPAATVLQILAVGLAIGSLSEIANAMLYALERQSYLAALWTVFLPLNVIGAWFIVPRWGAVGAAVLKATLYILITAVAIRRLGRIVEVPFAWMSAIKIYAAGIVAFGPLAWLAAREFAWPSLLLASAVALAAYVAFVWLLGEFGREQWNLLLATLTRRAGKSVVAGA